MSLPESDELAPDDPDAEHEAVDILRLSQNRLPDGVIFAAGDVASSAKCWRRSARRRTAVWSDPILFHPDGTTSDASLVLQNDKADDPRHASRPDRHFERERRRQRGGAMNAI